MIKKVVQIRNVGKFRNCAARGDVQFRGNTLLFAENGRGKTTLCDVLRSLQSGDPEPVTGRTTLGATKPPKVELLLDTGAVAKFEEGAWSETAPNLVVYDSRFVHENVFAGDFVAHEHKKNLYRVVVGEQGVSLARRVEELTESIKDAHTRLKAAESDVIRHVPKGVDLRGFLRLEEDDDGEKDEAALRKVVGSLEQTAEIDAASVPVPLTLPTLPVELEATLTKTLEDVSEDAEMRVRVHLESHMRRPDEEWLAQGQTLVRDDACPFCAQALASSDVFSAYKSYFANSYEALKKELEDLHREVSSFGTEAARLRLWQAVEENTRRLEFWMRHLEDAELPELDTSDLGHALERLREEALAAVGQKQARPLDPVMHGESYREAAEGMTASRETVEAYNTAVSALGKRIAARRADVKSGDLAEAKHELLQLEATRIRHTKEVDDACRACLVAESEKKKLEVAKEESKVELEQYSETVFQTYQEDINRILGMFGANFRIENTRSQYRGDAPSYSYALVINETVVEVGDARTPLSKPSFKNTLSAGDRSTLALSFFLARLGQDPQLAERTVVFDDPFTSQDRSRRTCTQQELCRLSGKVNQVIVLSHDAPFLKLIWDDLPPAAAKTLQLSRFGPGSTVTEWDIENHVKDDYFKNHAELRKYRDYGVGVPRHVAKTIRILLEGYLRFKLPGSFDENQWLGDYVRAIREALPDNPIAAAQGILAELEAIKDYAKRYHHAQNPNAESESLDEGELENFVRRTLSLVGGF